jgi:hypothetical protein
LFVSIAFGLVNIENWFASFLLFQALKMRKMALVGVIGRAVRVLIRSFHVYYLC